VHSTPMTSQNPTLPLNPIRRSERTHLARSINTQDALLTRLCTAYVKIDWLRELSAFGTANRIEWWGQE
jgi:hypothetical protein